MCQRCNYRRMLDGMGLDSTPNENHPPHPHFQCRSCGALQCMQPASLNMDIREVQRSFAGEITGLDIRVSGICGNCLKTVLDVITQNKPCLSRSSFPGT